MSVTVASAGITDGPGLNLPESLPPPVLGETTAAQSFIAVLEAELTARLIDPPAEGTVEYSPHRASIHLRVIAGDLLAAGDEAGVTGSIAVLTGYRLYAARREFDEFFISISPPPPDPADSEAAAARAALERFNALASEMVGKFRTSDAQKTDRLLPALFATLIPTLEIHSGGDIQNQWPGPAAVLPESSRPSLSLDLLAARIDALHPRDDLKDALLRLITIIERSRNFPDLAATATLHARKLARAVDFLAALKAAEWLEEEIKRIYAERLHIALIKFADPATRSRGQRRLSALESSRQLMLRITALQGRDKTDVSSLIAALIIADTLQERTDQSGNPGEPGGRIGMLIRVADTMIEFRELPEISFKKRNFQKVHDKLQQRYAAAESTLCEQLTDLVARPDALADPALVSLLADPRQCLDDILRVRRVPGWIDAIVLLNPDIRIAFTNRIRRWCRQLLDFNRRPQAISLLRRFEDELSRFVPLPYESTLIAVDQPALEATGGQHRELMHRITTTRKKWAVSWSEGRPDNEAGRRLRLLHHLTVIMEEFAALDVSEDGADLLNRWTAWEIPPSVILRPARDIATRLKLATASAVDEKFDALARHLEIIERDLPLLRLYGRLRLRLGPVLETYPPDLASIFGQIMRPPPPYGWWIERRQMLAGLCRYALEAEYAHSRIRRKQEDSLRAYVNSLAEELLEVSDELP